MKMKMAKAAGCTAKAVIAAALLAAALPAALHAETPPTVDADSLSPAAGAGILTPTYLDCGTYYMFVSACMGKKEDSYIEIGKALWTEGRAIGNAGGITHEAMKERVYSMRAEWTKDSGENCNKMASLHKQYKGFCEGIYQGLKGSK